MPYVFEFLHSLWKYPSAHQFLRAYFEYSTPDEMLNDKRVSALSQSIERAESNATPFDCLRIEMQEIIMREKGCNSYQEFAALCEREKAAQQN